MTVAQSNVGWDFAVLRLSYGCVIFTKLQFLAFNTVTLFRCYDIIETSSRGRLNQLYDFVLSCLESVFRSVFIS